MKRDIKITNLLTEQVNTSWKGLDQQPTAELLRIINQEDQQVAIAIQKQLAVMAPAIDAIYQHCFLTHPTGRIFYIGAGSSGRMGVLDASEMLPTYHVQDKIIGIIAGGDKALRLPVEAVEDDRDAVLADLAKYNFGPADCLLGIGASGRTPYVVSGLEYAKSIGALTVGLCMNRDNQFQSVVDYNLVIETGPEVIAGSTRMKAGTATKMVLNMISTTLMVKAHKVYDNLMINVVANNEKLRYRAVQIVQQITGITNRDVIEQTLVATGYDCPLAIIMLVKNVTPNTARELWVQNHYDLRAIIG